MNHQDSKESPTTVETSQHPIPNENPGPTPPSFPPWTVKPWTEFPPKWSEDLPQNIPKLRKGTKLCGDACDIQPSKVCFAYGPKKPPSLPTQSSTNK